MKTFDLNIVTPEGSTFQGPVESLVLPAFEGELGVLPGHMHLVCLLKPGELRYRAAGKTSSLALTGGFAQVGPAKVVVLAETAELAQQIDLARAKARAAEMQQQLKGGVRLSEEQMAQIRGAILKELMRIKLAEKAGKL